jgi:hypothetical protein
MRAAWLVCAVLLFAVAVYPADSGTPQARPAVQLVAQFLRCDPRNLTLKAAPMPRPRASMASRYLFELSRFEARGKTESGYATVDAQRGAVMSVMLTSRFKRAARQPYDQRRATALRRKAIDALRSRGWSELCTASAPEVTYMGQRVYAYTWQQKMKGTDVYTGVHAGVGIAAATGELISYVTWFPRRPGTLRDVKVSEKAARGIAARSLASKTDTVAQKGGLFLSSPLAPHDGPIWAFDVSSGGRPFTQVIVDAVGGKVLTPAR